MLEMGDRRRLGEQWRESAKLEIGDDGRWCRISGGRGGDCLCEEGEEELVG